MKGYVVENGYMGYLDGKYVVPEHRRETMKLH